MISPKQSDTRIYKAVTATHISRWADMGFEFPITVRGECKNQGCKPNLNQMLVGSNLTGLITYIIFLFRQPNENYTLEY